MGITIKQVFDTNLDHLKIDRRFIKSIKEQRIGFMNKNQDHLEFFTGNLLGVNPIRFTSSDRQDWFEDILEIDEEDLKEGISEVGIDKSWKRANDAMNLSIIWLLHKFHKSSLSTKDKEEGMIESLLMLQYKFITSLMSHYFPYPADRAVAIATYEALSRKFAIKEYGSWQALLEARSRDIIGRRSVHYTTIDKLPDNKSIIIMIQDIQGRLKEVVKKMSKVFHNVKEQNLRVSSSSTVMDMDGTKEILDKSRDHTTYIRYLKDVVGDKPTFIREELVGIIKEVHPTTDPNLLIQSLVYCSDNFGRGGDKKIETFIEESLLHTYEWISDNSGTMSISADLGTLLLKLRNLYTASRMSDDRLILMRDLADHIVNRSVKTRNNVMKSSTRTALQLYVVLRAFTKNYYQG